MTDIEILIGSKSRKGNSQLERELHWILEHGTSKKLINWVKAHNDNLIVRMNGETLDLTDKMALLLAMKVQKDSKKGDDKNEME